MWVFHGTSTYKGALPPCFYQMSLSYLLCCYRAAADPLLRRTGGDPSPASDAHGPCRGSEGLIFNSVLTRFQRCQANSTSIAQVKDTRVHVSWCALPLV